MTRLGVLRVVAISMILLGVLLVLPTIARAAENESGFSLQVSPSPLVATLKPGQTTELELKVRNAGTASEELKIEPRSFKIDSGSDTIKLEDTKSGEFSKWVTFSAPNFTVEPGQWYTQKVKISVPENAGFSYSFALIISRKDVPVAESGRLLNGSVAVFTLINIDRPGAKRELKISSFSATQSVYEYLPAELVIRFNNSGNTIVQPYGNIFIQRGNDAKSLATLKVNESAGYILPDTTRSLISSWKDGFPYYEKQTTSTGVVESKLRVNWAQADRVRFGRYTANLVAVYNDGQRDVPLQATVTFWVIPWKIILVMLLISAIILAGIWSIGRKIWRLMRRRTKIKDVGDQ